MNTNYLFDRLCYAWLQTTMVVWYAQEHGKSILWMKLRKSLSCRVNCDKESADWCDFDILTTFLTALETKTVKSVSINTNLQACLNAYAHTQIWHFTHARSYLQSLVWITGHKDVFHICHAPATSMCFECVKLENWSYCVFWVFFLSSPLSANLDWQITSFVTFCIIVMDWAKWRVSFCRVGRRCQLFTCL